MSVPVSDDDLNAYVDGQLPPVYLRWDNLQSEGA